MSLHDLKVLLQSHHPLLVMDTAEECRAADVVEEACRQLRLPLFEWSLTTGLCRHGDGAPLDHRTHLAAKALQHTQNLEIAAAFLFKDLDDHFDDPAVPRLIRDLCARFRHSSSSLILLGHGMKLPAKLETEAVPYTLRLPDRSQLSQLLDHTIRGVNLRHGVISDLRPEDREAVLDSLLGLTENQARQAVARAMIEDMRLDATDIGQVQQAKMAALRDGGLLEFHPPADNPAQLGGFNYLRSWLKRAALGYSPQAKAMNLEPPKGILLAGVPGCGKSLAAKVIARDWQVPLLKLDAGSLFDKYIGESEKNFRRATELAEAMAPCVLWIDELEKAFAVGGDGSTDGGTSQRILATFLTWLQEKTESVFLVATANRIDRLPPELTRKGRFDEIFFVDLPTPDERREIFEIHLHRRRQDPAPLDLAALVQATDRFSGAEIEQIVISSLYLALERECPLDSAMLLYQIQNTVPLAHSRRGEIERLRTEARERFVPVTKRESTEAPWPRVA